jgi:putative redox protein
MGTTRQKLTFFNQDGQQLAAALETPESTVLGYAIFAHCFTCSKDIAAASRISRALCRQQIGVFRFDFTGLGNSEGDFANTDFSSNIQDLVAAAGFMRDNLAAPEILIGHSLGGAAVIAATQQIAESKAVATIGAPSDPRHVQHLFASDVSAIVEEGSRMIELAGRQFKIRKEFLEDLSQYQMEETLRNLRRALLIFHSPVDRIVDVEHARILFQAAKHPKSFVSLDNADHLLSRPKDSEYVASVLSAWASRYLSTSGNS